MEKSIILKSCAVICQFWGMDLKVTQILKLCWQPFRNGALRRCSTVYGMFAFALWDRRERQLSLVRDRLGIKPLYYGWAGKVFLFGSELKTFLAHPAFQGQLTGMPWLFYLRFNCIHAPHSIYKGICKLIPGTIFESIWL